MDVFFTLINKLTKLVLVNMVGYFVCLVPFSRITDFTICVYTASCFETELNAKMNFAALTMPSHFEQKSLF